MVTFEGRSAFAIDGSTRAFIRIQAHLISASLFAFRDSGLSVQKWIKPLWGGSDAAMRDFAK